MFLWESVKNSWEIFVNRTYVTWKFVKTIINAQNQSYDFVHFAYQDFKGLKLELEQYYRTVTKM